MQNEEEKKPPVKEEETPPPEKKVEEPPAETPKQQGRIYIPGECEPVGYGQQCPHCGWRAGDPNPHVVHTMPQNVAVPVEATVAPPEPSPPPAPDPNACAPVAQGSTCTKCGWNSTDPDAAVSGKAHPVY
jgi:hypothetical protein